MIKLTRLNGTVLLVNENFIEVAEETPDTVITMQNGHRYVVKEKTEDIIQKVNDFMNTRSIPQGKNDNNENNAPALTADGSDIDYMD